MENRTPVKAVRNPYLIKETEKDPKLGSRRTTTP